MSTNNTSKHIVLVGAMGAGKTTIGKSLATYLNFRFVDSDCLFQTVYGVAGAEIIERYGIEEFRRLEEPVILRALGITERSVIATGAGVILSRIFREACKEHAIIRLDANEKNLVDRLTRSDRVLVKHAKNVSHLVARQKIERDHLYKELANIYFDTSLVDIDESVKELANQLINFGVVSAEIL